MLKIIAVTITVMTIGSNPAKAVPIPNPHQEYKPISHSTIPNARHQRKFANPVKLIVRHYPLPRIFADEDDDPGFSVAQHAMHYRREIVLAPVKNTVDSDAVSGSVALRLWLIRQRVLAKHQEIWG